MDELISRAIYHPLIAPVMLYLSNLLYSVDYSLWRAALIIFGAVALRFIRTLTRENSSLADEC